MYEVTINHKNKGLTAYKIYKKEECDDKEIKYKYWKDACEGDYALSDDGWCAEVIKRKEYPNNHKQTTVYIRLPWGYFMWNPKYPTIKFNAEGRITPHTITGKPYLEANKKSEKMINLAMCYAQTMNKDLAIDLALGSLTRMQHGSWKRKMKTEVFRDMVREELAKLLTKHGMTEDYTLELLADTIENAKGKKDITNLMRAVENLQGMHGMKERQVVKTTHQLEGTVTRKLLDQIHEEEQKLKATKITEGEYEPQKLSETREKEEVQTEGKKEEG